MRIDLTPFGFTPSENAAYVALLDGGPASGYALAKRLSVARANAYQALNGLVKKQAATVTGGAPRRYRAVRPDALLALVINASSQSIDLLATQVAEAPAAADPSVVTIEGERALVEIAMRTAARAEGEVLCIAPARLLINAAPAWRRRETDGKSTKLWQAGEDGGARPIAVDGIIPTEKLTRLFGSLAFLLVTGATAIVARISEDTASGFWATDRTLVGLARAMALSLTQERARSD